MGACAASSIENLDLCCVGALVLQEIQPSARSREVEERRFARISGVAVASYSSLFVADNANGVDLPGLVGWSVVSLAYAEGCYVEISLRLVLLIAIAAPSASAAPPVQGPPPQA
jgi:hypothetical protein